MDEKELKQLETQLEDLGKSIDSKLEDFSTKAKDASVEEMKKLQEDFKKTVKSDMEAELKEYNEKNIKLQEQIDELDTKLQRADFSGVDHKTLIDQIKSQLIEYKGENSLKDMIHKNKGVEFSLKVDDMTTGVNLSGAVIAPQRIPGIVYDPDRTEHVRDLLASGTTSSSTVNFVYESAIDDNTDVTAEGNEYKQSDFDLALTTATVRKITAYIMLSEEMLDDIEGLTSYITARLPSKLKVKEDQQLLYGSGGGQQLSGLTVNATAYSDNLADADISRIDVLVDAMRQIRDDEYQATACLIHPTDATLIKLTKDDNGNYIHPWIFMPSGQIVLDGVPVVVSTAITAGQFLVGDFRRGAQIFDRKDASLEFSYQNEDNFIKGMVTVRISERLTLATYRALCFIYGSFAEALASGSL